jgi:hypothetical protein
MKFLPIVYSLFLLLLHLDLSGQISNVAANEFTFMFYNTENFFDTEDDSLTNDEEYTSEADRRWNPARLHKKAERLAKVILAAGKWNAPVAIGLCEVEDLKVLELLTKNEPKLCIKIHLMKGELMLHCYTGLNFFAHSIIRQYLSLIQGINHLKPGIFCR